MAYREGAAGLLSENQRIRGLISSVIDIVLLIAAYLLANFLRFNWLPFFEEGGAGPALDIARSPMVALGLNLFYQTFEKYIYNFDKNHV